MPTLQRSLKSMVVEALFVIVILTIVGHISVNFWEKYFIQSELAQVKNSLHSLKKTLVHIGYAYDNLHRELKEVLDIDKYTDVAVLPTLPKPAAPGVEPKSRHKYILDRRRQHDIQVNAALTPEKKEKPGILKKYNIDNAATQSMPENDATTITRRPLRPAAVEADLSNEQCSLLDDTCTYDIIKDKLKF